MSTAFSSTYKVHVYSSSLATGEAFHKSFHFDSRGSAWSFCLDIAMSSAINVLAHRGVSHVVQAPATCALVEGQVTAVHVRTPENKYTELKPWFGVSEDDPTLKVAYDKVAEYWV